ncbi:MAG: macrolide export protein MacA [Patescibacteria group bacterium]|nr:MAG: macrolide export protein MacA [Patescibacteria group bacterium]
MKIINILKNKKGLIVILFLIILIAVFLFFKNKNKIQNQYQTVKIIRETLIQSVSASGKIVSSSSYIVNTLATGVVKKIYVKNGDYVKKGEKILEIDLDFNGQKNYQQAWSNYLSAKNNLDSANATLYSLQSDLFSKWKTYFDLATSPHYQNSDGTPNLPERQNQIEFLTTEANWKAAEAKYKNQEQTINQLKIALNNAWLNYQSYSPVVLAQNDGIVQDLIYTEGMIIDNSSNNSSNIKIATIKSESLPIGQFSVSEIDALKIEPGQKATIVIDALPDKTFTGEVIAIDKTGEVNSSVVNYPLTIKFDSQTDEVLPNMSATANIIVNKKSNVLTVPSTAIINQEDSNYLRILKNGKIILTPVEIGISSDTKTEIVSGVSEGDEVVVSIVSNNSNSNNNQSPFSSFGIGVGTRIRMR